MSFCDTFAVEGSRLALSLKWGEGAVLQWAYRLLRAARLL